MYKKIIIGISCIVVIAGVITLVIINKDNIFKDSSTNNINNTTQTPTKYNTTNSSTNNFSTIEDNTINNQNEIDFNNTNNPDLFSEFVTKKYSGKSTQTDSNKENSDLIISNYTLTFISNNNCSLEIKTLYKAKENTIKSNNINITSTDVAAGTSYIEFEFTGTDDNGNKYDGSGTISYSNVANNDEIGLTLNINQNIFDDISVSTEFLNLELNRN